MKQRLLCLALSASCALGLMAEPVTRQQAAATARQFFASQGASLSSTSPVRMAPPKSGSATSSYYIFNADDGKGFVIVSGDDRTPAVLGYSDTGEFDFDSAPDNLRAWLQGYADQIEYIQKHNLNVAKTPASDDKAVIPSMVTAKWNQGQPYNYVCPTVNGVKGATGCVATAMAQVLYYHYTQSPDKMVTALQADIPDYDYLVYWPEQVSASIKGFAKGSPIDWQDMQPTYGTTYSDAQRDAVANLMAYCGTSITIEYSSDSYGTTSGYTYKIPKAFAEYFGMDKSVRYYRRNNYTTTQWEEIIYSELQNHRPVIYSGFSNGGGHAFVIDGYEGNDYYHVNWGWGGGNNGAFLLSVLNPGGSGIGGAGADAGYNSNQEIVVNIQPDAGHEAPLGLEPKVIRFFQSSSGSYILSYEVLNGGSQKIRPEYGFGIRAADGSISFCPSSRIQSNIVAGDDGAYCQVDLTQLSLAPGTYDFVPCGRMSNTDEWQSLCGRDKVLRVTVRSNGSMSMYNYPTYSISVNGLATSGLTQIDVNSGLDFTVSNTGRDKYSGALYLFASQTGIKGSHQSTIGVSVEPGSTKSYTVEWKPAEAGTYTLWLCFDKDGNNVLGTLRNVVIGSGHIVGSAFRLANVVLDKNIVPADVDWQAGDDGRLYKRLTGDSVAGRVHVFANDLAGSRVDFELLYVDNATGQLVAVDNSACSWKWTLATGKSKWMTFPTVRNLKDGQYVIRLYAKDRKGGDWSNDNYGFYVGAPTGIAGVRTQSADGRVSVYNLQGVRLGVVDRSALSQFLDTLPRGVYIVGGKKVSRR